MRHTGWQKEEVRRREDLDEKYWYQGFFHLDFGNNRVYRRDFEEIRLRDISLFTLGDIEGKKILDIGCGSGLYSLTFLKMGAKTVCGQDISEEAIKEVTETCQREGFTNFVGKTGDCAKLQFEESEFDLVFSGDVFEHITSQQKEQFILEAFRVLKPGGLFTVKTPNKKYLKLTNWLHRLKAVSKFKDPFNIHIAHTKNNPDNEHHGLIDHKDLIRIFDKTMFHTPLVAYQPLGKKGLPIWLAQLFRKSFYFNQHVIITVRKPIFYGIYK